MFVNIQSGIRWTQPVTDTSTDTPYPEAERLVTTVIIIPH
jgi:hypothetical protein